MVIAFCDEPLEDQIAYQVLEAQPEVMDAIKATNRAKTVHRHVKLTPFGEDGPWAGFATSDLVSLALGGVVMNCGYDPDPAGRYDLPPIAPQAWHSFHIAGEQLVIGIVSALLYRLRSGLGQKVSVAIHEAVAKNTEIDLMSWVMLRQPVYRQTCRHALATITNPSISYTKDGRWNLSMHVGERELLGQIEEFEVTVVQRGHRLTLSMRCAHGSAEARARCAAKLKKGGTGRLFSMTRALTRGTIRRSRTRPSHSGC